MSADGIGRVLREAARGYRPPPLTLPRRGPKTKVGSLHSLARSAGVHPGSLYHFMAGKGGLNLRSLEALCDELGLELKPRQLTAMKKGGASAGRPRPRRSRRQDD